MWSCRWRKSVFGVDKTAWGDVLYNVRIPVWLIVVAAFATVIALNFGAAYIVSLYPSLFKKPSYQGQYDQCRKTCLDRGMFGELKRRPGQVDQKQSAVQFDCSCF